MQALLSSNTWVSIHASSLCARGRSTRSGYAGHQQRRHPMAAFSCRLTRRCVMRIGLLWSSPLRSRRSRPPQAVRPPCLGRRHATPAPTPHPFAGETAWIAYLPIGDGVERGSDSSTRTGPTTIRSRPTCMTPNSCRTGRRTGRGSCSRREAGRRSHSMSTIWRRRPPASSLPVRTPASATTNRSTRRTARGSPSSGPWRHL